MINLEQANRIITAIFSGARELNCRPMSVIVVEPGAKVKAFQKEDDSAMMRFEMAFGKAYAALALGRSSSLVRMRTEERPLFMQYLIRASDDQIFPGGGGMLVRDSKWRAARRRWRHRRYPGARRGTRRARDEIHADLVHDPHRHLPVAAVDDDVASRTVTVSSASKAFNLAGLRWAIMHVGHRPTLDAIDVLPPHLLGAPNLLWASKRRSPPGPSASSSNTEPNQAPTRRCIARLTPTTTSSDTPSSAAIDSRSWPLCRNGRPTANRPRCWPRTPHRSCAARRSPAPAGRSARP